MLKHADVLDPMDQPYAQSMPGEDDPRPRWRRTHGRLGWSVMALFGVALGLTFVVGFLATGDGDLVSPAFFITFGVFVIACGVNLLLNKGIGPTRSAAARRIRHPIRSCGVPAVEIRLRRAAEVFGAILFLCLFALVVETAAAAIQAGHPLLGALVSLLAILIVPVIVETVTTWRCRRALVLTPETLAIERGSDRITLAWDDLESVEMDVRTVRIQRIIPFRYAYVLIRLKAGPTSLAVTPRRRLRILPRRYERDGILISTVLLDRPERVRHLLDTMRHRPRHGDPEQQRQDLLSSAVGYLNGRSASL
ncbi:hypothetical protein WBG06_00435 [Nocardioides sp. CCNWLW239]|uniref:hypothetical protein n=1 Tax=Nocardioides sp. CCNWLW239 TaxID=3128902 RepID=UPI00301AE883